VPVIYFNTYKYRQCNINGHILVIPCGQSNVLAGKVNTLAWLVSIWSKATFQGVSTYQLLPSTINIRNGFLQIKCLRYWVS